MAGQWTRLVGALGAAAALAAAGCAHPQERRAEALQKVSEQAVDKAAFADELALLDHKEIAMAQIAQERSQNPEVRMLAQRLLRDHSEHLDRLQQWAGAKALELSTMDLSLPEEGVGGAGTAGMEQKQEQQLSERSEKQMKELDRKAEEDRKELTELREARGPDFDKAFLAQVRKDQKEGMDLVKSGRKDFQGDGSLTALLVQTEPLLEQHAEFAKRAEKSLR